MWIVVEQGNVYQSVLRNRVMKQVSTRADVVVIDGCSGRAEGISGGSHGNENASRANIGVGWLAMARRS